MQLLLAEGSAVLESTKWPHSPVQLLLLVIDLGISVLVHVVSSLSRKLAPLAPTPMLRYLES